MRKGGPHPHLVAAMASSLVLVVGLAVMAYFVEVRGIGLRAELASTRALELQVLCAALVGMAILTQICVARVVGASRPSRGVDRRLLQKALDVDYADPEVVRHFDAVPELRELVGMLLAEKTQTRELGDRLEMVSGEVDGLVEGMQRSSEDLGPLREEGSSPFGQHVVRYWNGLVLRVREAEEAVEQAAERVVVPQPEVEVAPPSGVATLVARLDELETELGMLRTAVRQPDAAPGAKQLLRPNVGFEPVAGARPLLGATDGLADAPFADPWKVKQSATTPVGEDSDWGAVTPVEPIVQTKTWNLSAPFAPPGSDLFLGEEELVEPQAALEALPTPDFVVERNTIPPVRSGGSIQSPAVAAQEATPDLPSFDDIDFPHFVGKPVRPMPDHVEVTYETQASEEVVELPASALLFEAEPETPGTAAAEDEEEVLDLRAFGALEFDR